MDTHSTPHAVADGTQDLASHWARSARRLRNSTSVADIHAFRTASRRLLARLPEPCDDNPQAPERAVRRLRRRLKGLLKAAAPLREAHVLSKLSLDLWSQWNCLQDLLARLEHREQEGAPTLAAALKNLRIRRTRNRLCKRVSAPLILLGDPRLDITTELRHVRRDNTARLHRLRLRVKRLRYLLEATPAWPAAHVVVASLQEALGTLHDLDELAVWRNAVVGAGGTPPAEGPWQTRRAQAWSRFLQARRTWLALWQARMKDQESGRAEVEQAETEWILLRHGPAGHAAQPRGVEDRDRPLTVDGLQLCCCMAERLAERGWTCQLVLTSPLARALQTAEAVCKTFGEGTELGLLKELEPEASCTKAERALRKAAQGEPRVIVVGHEPLLSTLAAHLAGSLPARPLRKAGLIRLAVGLSGRARLLDWLDPDDGNSSAT